MNFKPQQNVDLNSTINLLALSSNSTNSHLIGKSAEPDKLRQFYESHLQNEINLDDTYDLLGSIAITRFKKNEPTSYNYCQNLKLNESLDKEEEELLNAIYSKHKINFNDRYPSLNPPNSIEFKQPNIELKDEENCKINTESDFKRSLNILEDKRKEDDQNYQKSYGNLMEKIEKLKQIKNHNQESYNCFTLGNSIEIESEDKLNFIPESKTFAINKSSLLEILGLIDNTINIKSGYPSQIITETIVLNSEEETRIKVYIEKERSRTSASKRENSTFVFDNDSKHMNISFKAYDHFGYNNQDLIVLSPNKPTNLRFDIVYPKSLFEIANVEYYTSFVHFINLCTNEELTLNIIGTSEKPCLEVLSDDAKMLGIDHSSFKYGKRENLLLRNVESGPNNFYFCEGVHLLPIINRSFNTMIFKVETVGTERCSYFSIDVFPPKLTLRSNKTEFIKLSVQTKPTEFSQLDKSSSKFVLRLSMIESKLAYYFMFTFKEHSV